MVASLNKRMNGADVTRLWPCPSPSVLAGLRLLSAGRLIEFVFE
jgi:hypothetical protein